MPASLLVLLIEVDSMNSVFFFHPFVSYRTRPPRAGLLCLCASSMQSRGKAFQLSPTRAVVFGFCFSPSLDFLFFAILSWTRLLCSVRNSAAARVAATCAIVDDGEDKDLTRLS
jgi:hypothetical protein